MKKFFAAILLIFLFSIPAFAGFDIPTLRCVLISSCKNDVAEKEISNGDSYLIGISESEFDEYISSCVICAEKCGISGYFGVIAECRDCSKAGEVYEIMVNHKEWMPCDPAEKMIFFTSENVVLMIKGSEDEASLAKAKILSVFGEKTYRCEEFCQNMQ